MAQGPCSPGQEAFLSIAHDLASVRLQERLHRDDSGRLSQVQNIHPELSVDASTRVSSVLASFRQKEMISSRRTVIWREGSEEFASPSRGPKAAYVAEGTLEVC